MTKKNIVRIAVPPGQPQFFHDGEEFRLATFPDPPALLWTVYGGEDGRVIVYKSERARWEELCPTKKSHDYLFVSIKTVVGDGYFQPYVHQVILRAFEGPPPTPSSVGKHRNDNPEDNRRGNLSWGTKSANAADAHRHRRSGSAPSDRRLHVPIRRAVVTRLRESGPSKGKPFEDFVERILVEFLDRLDNQSKPL